ncbi:MAG: hypothetical protein MZV63_55820 [Marinilabiliales bacterium]|nr:hypothetical protein [Marinilabiliales bacterium]
MRQLLALIGRLRQCLPTLSAQALSQPLMMGLARLHSAIDALQSELARYQDHDPQPDPRCGADPANPGPQPARDQPSC